MKTRLSFIAPLILATLVGCAASSHLPNADTLYQSLAEDYLTGYLAWRPGAGTGLGLHEYDGKVTDLSAASLAAEHARLVKFREALGEIVKHRSLSPDLSREARTLLCSIDGELQSFDVFRSYTHNPMTYAGAYDLTTYAKRDFAPKPQRLRSVIAILKKTPDSLAAARANLEEHLPKVFITTAIEQANGSADFMTDDLVKAFEDVKDPALQSEFVRTRAVAASALRDYAKWLSSEKLPKADDSFLLGRDGYIRMLRDTELLTQSPEQILEIAERELKREQRQFAAAAAEIDPSKPAIAVFKSIQRDHPTEQSLIPDATRRLDTIRQFIIDRSLVSFPSMVSVKVEETPKFARATSFASMDSPGPFERAAEAFYYITPPEPDWDAKKKEEWLTSFNFYATDVTSIHESYPGHYVQSLHLKASDASKIAKIFGSYAYIEGWAHYCEQMVIDEGFPEAGDRVKRAKYRLEQSQESLLRICRLCVSVRMHCQKMSIDEATRFFVENCYYEPAPARQEAKRGAFDPGYGFYTLGKLQILKLREDYRRQEGSGFTLQRFHDALLDHGQPPIRLLREALLKNRELWEATM